MITGSYHPLWQFLWRRDLNGNRIVTGTIRAILQGNGGYRSMVNMCGGLLLCRGWAAAYILLVERLAANPELKDKRLIFQRNSVMV